MDFNWIAAGIAFALWWTAIAALFLIAAVIILAAERFGYWLVITAFLCIFGLGLAVQVGAGL